MQAYFLVILSILLGAAGQVLMKLGTTRLDLASAPSVLRKLVLAFTQPHILEGLLCYGLSAVLWIFGLSKLPLSKAYPMVASGYVLVFVLSVFLFKEPVNLYKVGGMLLILSGVMLIARA